MVSEMKHKMNVAIVPEFNEKEGRSRGATN